MDNVILNIYDLLPESGDQQAPSSSGGAPSQPSGLSGFFSGLLAPLGFGAYHTSIDVRGFRYQFGATVGITRTSSPQGGGETAESRRFVPLNGAYRESIILGQTWCEQGEINAIIHRMREETPFTGDNYHLANRNCNHFAETFATALIVGNGLLEEHPKALQKFPAWVNRLPKTGTSLGLDDGKACDVVAEARIAAGLKGKVGWELSSSSAKKPSGSAKNRTQKKELTEKQKAALAKLKKSSSKK